MYCFATNPPRVINDDRREDNDWWCTCKNLYVPPKSVKFYKEDPYWACIEDIKEFDNNQYIIDIAKRH